MAAPPFSDVHLETVETAEDEKEEFNEARFGRMARLRSCLFPKGDIGALRIMLLYRRPYPTKDSHRPDTNATLVDDAAAAFLRENGANIAVSLYGHCAEIHEKVTQRAGSFSQTERGLKLLKQYGVPVRIAVVIMDVNETHIPDIQRYIENIGFAYEGYDTIRQAFGGTQRSHCVCSADVLSVRYQTKACFATSEEAFIRNHCVNSCWHRKLAFAANGDVYPCIFARDFRIGNIKEDSFDQLFAKAGKVWATTIDTVEGCRECEFRYACKDCRPLAKSLTGKPDGKYPRCTYSPAEGIWKSVEEVSVELKKPEVSG